MRVTEMLQGMAVVVVSHQPNATITLHRDDEADSGQAYWVSVYEGRGEPYTSEPNGQSFDNAMFDFVAAVRFEEVQ